MANTTLELIAARLRERHESLADHPTEREQVERQEALFGQMVVRLDRRTAPRADRGIATMIVGLAEYIDAFPTTEDGALVGESTMEENIESIVLGLRGLLNGPTGTLHCGNISSLLREIAETNGVSLPA